MKFEQFIVLSLLCGLVNSEESDTFDSILGKSDACKDECLRSFPLHTYDRPSNLEACDRGCRLFSICEWSIDDQDFNKTLVECTAACDEAYGQNENKFESESCKFGCKSAVLPAKQRQNKLDKEEPHIHPVVISQSLSLNHQDNIFGSFGADPFDQFFSHMYQHPLMMASDNMMQNMLNYMTKLMNSDVMSSSMLSLGNKDTDEVIIISFGSNLPEINTQHPLEKLIKHNTDGNKIHPKTTLVDRIIESNLQTNLYEKHHPYTNDYWFSDYYDDFDHFDNPNLETEFEEWWNCFVKKAGLPELALLFFWMSTMILLVMCCTMQFPSKKNSTKLSIHGDLAYIKETKGHIPDFLQVYGHTGVDVVRFTEVKNYKPDEKIPLSVSF
uniref:uncharacterized protein LOC120337704 n=1 Tax=Styela clava TaxID=7725 RepID=UPI00193A9F8C|nr:uncharacterized protein LOC120337704 [Styela clava]